MKLAIIGSRSFTDYEKLSKECNAILKSRKITEVVSGGAKGADTLGAQWANEMGLALTVFKPDWAQFGKRAGYIRNVDIIEACDIVIAFWDCESKGTAHSISIAEAAGKPTIIKTYSKLNT